MSKRIGILFSVFEGDAKHHDRFLSELTRLELPFAVNFDHCSPTTITRFTGNRYFHGCYVNDDPNNHFTEAHRQRALEILQRDGFDYALGMDVDETLEYGARGKIDKMVSLGADIVDVRVLDLWGDGRHYRKDGPFQASHREKLYWLKSDAGVFKYFHPHVHAPKINNPSREVVTARYHELRVLHWGIMDSADVAEHTQRWNGIYKRALGKNPYGFYPYINDPETQVDLVSVPDDVYYQPEGGAPCCRDSNPDSSSVSTTTSPTGG